MSSETKDLDEHLAKSLAWDDIHRLQSLLQKIPSNRSGLLDIMNEALEDRRKEVKEMRGN